MVVGVGNTGGAGLGEAGAASRGDSSTSMMSNTVVISHAKLLSP